MELERLTIGQMAELNGVSAQTLRLYDRQGLLTPRTTDAVTGYRYYHITQSARLDMIQHMKAYGMTLKEIHTQLDEGDPEQIRTFLTTQLGVISERQRTLEHRKRAIARTLENYRRADSLPTDGSVFLEYLPTRFAYTHHAGCNFFDQDYAGYEFILRQLKHRIERSRLDPTYFCNVGTIMRREALGSGTFFTDEFFLFVDQPDSAAHVETIPAATYACICAHDFYAERANAAVLLEYIQSNGFAVQGDYICEVIIDFPIFNHDRREMFYKIQIPVSRK